MRPIILLLAILATHAVLGQNTYLWKVSSRDNAKVSFLFGTQHQVRESFFKKYPVLERSLLSCDQVITEVEIKRDSVLSLFGNREATNDLEKTLSAKSYKEVKELLKNSSIDPRLLTPEEIVGALQRCFELLNCEPLNESGSYHLDQYIQVLADQNKKSNYYLETMAEQLSYIDNVKNRKMTWADAKKYVNILLKQYAKYKKSGKSTCPDLLDLYLSFRIDYQLSKSCSTLNNNKQQLITQRNAKWMQVLPGLIQQKNVFVAVGLEHLNFDCGLIMQLRKAGYTVEPVDMQTP